nr:IS1182 family transposase [Streptomyces sp. CBMA152]
MTGWTACGANPRDGRPGLSPAQLATVCVLQFLPELSDRQAAEAVRCRIDFTYALSMEMDDPGFHHSVLADFRERLAETGRADQLLELALKRIQAAGLLTERGRQRTDSTHVLASVRDLTRIELVTESIRAALEEIARLAPEELIALVIVEWGQRYGRAARLGKNPTRPKTRINYLGEDADLLLRHVASLPRGLREGPRVQVLRQIFLQNYFLDGQGRIRWRMPTDAGLPPTATAIVSPYDVIARYARRGDTRWKGFLAHVTETCDADAVNIITDVITTVASGNDARTLPTVHTRLKGRGLLPAEHLVDGGYISVAHRDRAVREYQIHLVGPVKEKITRKSRKGNGFDRDAFTIDWERQQVTCPQGKESMSWAAHASVAPAIHAKFSQRDCRQCSVKVNCTRSPRRLVSFYPRELHDVLATARAEQQTHAWKTRYAMRAGVESTINELVHGHGMRRCRYRSRGRAHVQHILTAIAINVERISAQTPVGTELRPDNQLLSRTSWTKEPSHDPGNGAPPADPAHKVPDRLRHLVGQCYWVRSFSVSMMIPNVLGKFVRRLSCASAESAWKSLTIFWAACSTSWSEGSSPPVGRSELTVSMTLVTNALASGTSLSILPFSRFLSSVRRLSSAARRSARARGEPLSRVVRPASDFHRESCCISWVSAARGADCLARAASAAAAGAATAVPKTTETPMATTSRARDFFAFEDMCRSISETVQTG